MPAPNFDIELGCASGPIGDAWKHTENPRSGPKKSLVRWGHKFV